MADKPKRRSKAVSPRIRKAITDAQLLKKNALVQKLDREAKTNKPKRISKAVSPRIRKAITDAQLLKKNLSPQVLKFVKTKMQRTLLSRNHPAIKAMLNARTESELKKAHIKFKAAHAEVQDKIVATTNKKSNEVEAKKERNADEAAQKAKTGEAETNKPKRISKAVSPLIKKAAEAAAQRKRNVAKRKRNAAKRRKNSAIREQKIAERERIADEKAKAAAQKKRNVAEALRKSNKAAKQAEVNKREQNIAERKRKQARIRANQEKAKSVTDNAFLTEVLWPLRRERQESAGNRSGESRRKKPSATGGERTLPFAGRFEGNPLSEKGDEPVDTVIRSQKSKIKPKARVKTGSKKIKVAAKVRPTKPLPHTIEGYDIETGAPVGDDPALVKSPLIRDPVREGYEGPFKISTDTEDYDVGHKHGGKVGRGKKQAKSRKRTTKGRKRAALRGHRKELRGG